MDAVLRIRELEKQVDNLQLVIVQNYKMLENVREAISNDVCKFSNRYCETCRLRSTLGLVDRSLKESRDLNIPHY